MNEQDWQSLPDKARAVQRASSEHQEREQEHATAPGTNPSAVERVACRAGDDSCAKAHASTLNRATASRPARAERSVLSLQRQYGNHYVERVLTLARQSASAEETSTGVPAEVESSIQQKRGSGHNLDSGVRKQMEGALGADFSGVRVHVDAQADSLNRNLNARAFTTGSDIFFSQNAYQPGNSTGRELIAHELTHVVQQDGDKVRRAMTVSHPEDAHEVEAEETARAVMQTETSSVNREDAADQTSLSASRSSAQRQPEVPKEEDEEKHKHLTAMKADRSVFSDQMHKGRQS